ncbi:hypothetical protein OG426_24530 [Streptomyces canus]|uniref:hypothetical protein n=1 Tax=Streptomyces canus TaxID=58343 RepID=UPI0022539647|nr:hypothetical protein [Streptomyces canus]MCX4859326.1 hypothetical protein [Streptomyces canus]WSW35418.1 hypothetical protein OG426_24530 [Streptomyces canus]
MTSGRVWVPGAGAVLVLVATGVWAMRPSGVDADLWTQVRPAIEARLVDQSRGAGYGESVSGLRARWFCRAEALDLDERDGLVRAGVSTLCVEYGVRAGRLVECSGAEVPQVLQLRWKADGDYVVVSQEEPPDGAGNAEWLTTHFGHATTAALDTTVPSGPLESAARTHFGLPAGAAVVDC